MTAFRAVAVVVAVDVAIMTTITASVYVGTDWQ